MAALPWAIEASTSPATFVVKVLLEKGMSPAVLMVHEGGDAEDLWRSQRLVIGIGLWFGRPGW